MELSRAVTVCFQYGNEAKAFWEALKQRLCKFGLRFAEEKSRVIEFDRYAWEEVQRQGGRVVTFNFLGFTHQFKLGIGKIRGGVQATSTAGECVIDGPVSFTPAFGSGISGIKKVKELLKNAIAEASNKDPWLRRNPTELYFTHYDDAYEVNPDEEIVQTLIEAGKKVIGKAPEIGTLVFDARHLVNQSGIPTIVYGPGNPATIQGPDEYVDIEDLIKGTKILALAIYRLCK